MVCSSFVIGYKRRHKYFGFLFAYFASLTKYALFVYLGLQVLQTGQEITELDNSGFATQSPTVFAGNIGQERYIVQVRERLQWWEKEAGGEVKSQVTFMIHILKCIFFFLLWKLLHNCTISFRPLALISACSKEVSSITFSPPPLAVLPFCSHSFLHWFLVCESFAFLEHWWKGIC